MISSSSAVARYAVQLLLFVGVVKLTLVFWEK